MSDCDEGEEGISPPLYPHSGEVGIACACIVTGDVKLSWSVYKSPYAFRMHCPIDCTSPLLHCWQPEPKAWLAVPTIGWWNPLSKDEFSTVCGLQEGDTVEWSNSGLPAFLLICPGVGDFVSGLVGVNSFNSMYAGALILGVSVSKPLLQFQLSCIQAE